MSFRKLLNGVRKGFLKVTMAVGLGFVVLVGLLGIACSREEQAFDTPPVIEMKGSQCLKEMDQSIDKYVMGNSSEAEVNQFWNCLGHAFQMFAKRTKGSEEGLYSAKELRNFLETFFLGEIRLSDDFLVEFMHLKRLFLGGSIQYVSLREIDESLVLFDKFRRLTLDLRPHIDLLNGTLYQNRIENHPEELDLALREFSKIVGRFFSLIEEAHQEYEFENFKNLLLEVIDLVKGEDELRRKLFVVQLVPLLSQLKNQLVGSPLDKILAHQWKPMAEILSEVFGLWIRYEHISYHKGWPQDERQRNLSILRMNDSIHRLGQWISQTDEDLDWIELEDMLEKIDGILYLRSGESSIEKLRNLLPLAGELKTQLVGGDKNRVAPFEWPLLIHRLGQILEIKMAWTYLVRPFSWNEGFGFLQLNRIAHLGLGVIEEVLESRPTQIVPIAEINSLVLAIEQANLLPLGLTAKSINTVLPAILGKILINSNSSQENSETNGFGQEHLRFIANQWEEWAQAQKFSIQFVTDPSPPLKQDPSVLKEVFFLLQAPWPLVMDPQGRLIFRSRGEVSWTASAVTQLNASRALLRLLIMAYAGDSDCCIEDKGLNRYELEMVEEDLFPLLVDIGLFGPEERGVSSRIFLESDLFMPRSNGNELIELAEGIEYMTFVLSGISAGKVLLQSIPGDCRIYEMEANEIEERVLTPCFRQELRNQGQDLWAHLPGLLNYSQSLSLEEWNQLMGYLETAVRGTEGASIEIPIKTSDIKELMILGQYLETFFLRFDSGSVYGSINLKEALGAFPIYDLPLLSLLGFADRSDREALFTYMMKNCQPPPQDLDGLELLQQWKKLKEEWSFEADRLCLTHVLSELAKAL